MDLQAHHHDNLLSPAEHAAPGDPDCQTSNSTASDAIQQGPETNVDPPLASASCNTAEQQTVHGTSSNATRQGPETQENPLQASAELFSGSTAAQQTALGISNGSSSQKANTCPDAVPVSENCPCNEHKTGNGLPAASREDTGHGALAAGLQVTVQPREDSPVTAVSSSSRCAMLERKHKFDSGGDQGSAPKVKPSTSPIQSETHSLSPLSYELPAEHTHLANGPPSPDDHHGRRPLWTVQLNVQSQQASSGAAGQLYCCCLCPEHDMILTGSAGHTDKSFSVHSLKTGQLLRQLAWACCTCAQPCSHTRWQPNFIWLLRQDHQVCASVMAGSCT